jgi:lysophospholipase L1-like esterase
VGLKTRLLLGCLALSAGIGAEPQFYLRDGDRVVFYGDSITNQRRYTVFVETFVLTRFPQLHIRFVHSGWDGDSVSGGGGGPIDLRLQRDVLAYNPTVLTVMLGMNDGGYQPYSPERFQAFAAGYRHLIEAVRAQAPDLRITLLEPSAYDDVTRPPKFEGGYNSVLVRYGVFLRALARREELQSADLNAPVVGLLRAVKSTDPDVAQQMIPDRVHPSPGVHLVMAEALLKAWQAPSVVTDVRINAASGGVESARNTTVAKLDTASGISWTQSDQALPMPVETARDTVALALRSSDFTAALNRQRLRVTGLAEGDYTLHIDGEIVADFSAAKLAGGINLAMLPTPMSRQANAVLILTFRRNHIHYARWRLLAESLREYRPAKLDAAVASLDELEEEIIALQRSTAQPTAHRYQIVRKLSAANTRRALAEGQALMPRRRK